MVSFSFISNFLPATSNSFFLTLTAIFIVSVHFLISYDWIVKMIFFIFIIKRLCFRTGSIHQHSSAQYLYLPSDCPNSKKECCLKCQIKSARNQIESDFCCHNSRFVVENIWMIQRIYPCVVTGQSMFHKHKNIGKISKNEKVYNSILSCTYQKSVIRNL